MVFMADVGRSPLSRENGITSTSFYAKRSPNWRKKYCKRDLNVEKVSLRRVEVSCDAKAGERRVGAPITLPGRVIIRDPPCVNLFEAISF